MVMEEGMMPKLWQSSGSRFAPMLYYVPFLIMPFVNAQIAHLCCLVLQIGDYLSVAIM